MNNYRYEIKFSLDEQGFTGVKHWMLSNSMLKKRYPDRYVSSIYLDDSNYSSIKDNLIGLPNRKKYRLRWYGGNKNINGEKYSKFEVKIRNGRLGKKIDHPLDLSVKELNLLSIDRLESMISKSMLGFNYEIERYFRMILAVHYYREYYEDNNGLRVTIDKKIRFQYLDGSKRYLDDCPSSNYHKYIAEVKFNPELKDYASKLMSNLHVSPVRNSKYLLGLSRFGYVNYI